MKKIYLLVAMFGALALEAAPLNFSWTVDTAELSGQSGQLSFQYNTSGTDATTATISQFGGAGLGSFSVIGNVSGDLSSSVVISPTNVDPLNEFLQNVTFGDSFKFVLALAGDLLDNPQDVAGSQFALQLTSGSLLLASVDIFPGLDPFVSLDSSVTETNPVPEPTTALLVLVAVPAGIWLRRRR